MNEPNRAGPRIWVFSELADSTITVLTREGFFISTVAHAEVADTTKSLEDGGRPLEVLGAGAFVCPLESIAHVNYQVERNTLAVNHGMELLFAHERDADEAFVTLRDLLGDRFRSDTYQQGWPTIVLMLLAIGLLPVGLTAFLLILAIDSQQGKHIVVISTNPLRMLLLNIPQVLATALGPVGVSLLGGALVLACFFGMIRFRAMFKPRTSVVLTQRTQY